MGTVLSSAQSIADVRVIHSGSRAKTTRAIQLSQAIYTGIGGNSAEARFEWPVAEKTHRESNQLLI